MPVLDLFLPAPRLRQVDRVAVAADPVRAWRAVRGVNLYALPFARFLFTLRTLPERLLGRGTRTPPTAFLDEVISTKPAEGFIRLAEVDGREFVAGAVGKVWRASLPFKRMTPETFAAFSEPGWGKVAWNLRVDPRDGGGSWITVEVRVTATDAASWRRFRAYWTLVGPFSHWMRRATMRRLVRELGAATKPRAMPITGDRLLPGARFDRTHSRMLDGPPARVWPWLVQMGCRRAGWYSIDLLDNGNVRSAERIIPELQKIAPGDLLPATPDDPGGFAVLRVDEGRALVLGSPDLLPGAKREAAWPYSVTWSFFLEPIGDDATLLVVRVRSDIRPSIRMAVQRGVIAGMHEVMERAQLRNLSRRVARFA